MSSSHASLLLEGSRSALAKAITLAESEKPDDQHSFQALLAQVLPHTGKGIRLGITGAPGVGKSSFIESFGGFLTSQGKRVAVLSIDPSSPLTKGSILGDKTRMEKLSRNPMAFIRPSASRNIQGGVAYATREAILLCEAAGFDIVLVETVGVGQSEFSVKDMCDCFLLLMLAGAGDELQGIKKGIMEMADIIAITKADGLNQKQAQSAQAEYQHALHLVRSEESGWTSKVVTCSALENTGITDVWTEINAFLDHQRKFNQFESNRQQQKEKWLNEQLNTTLRQQLTQQGKFGKKWNEAAKHVRENQWTVFQAVNFIMRPDA